MLGNQKRKAGTMFISYRLNLLNLLPRVVVKKKNEGRKKCVINNDSRAPKQVIVNIYIYNAKKTKKIKAEHNF